MIPRRKNARYDSYDETEHERQEDDLEGQGESPGDDVRNRYETVGWGNAEVSLEHPFQIVEILHQYRVVQMVLCGIELSQVGKLSRSLSQPRLQDIPRDKMGQHECESQHCEKYKDRKTKTPKHEPQQVQEGFDARIG